jgi:hypothetical protein
MMWTWRGRGILACRPLTDFQIDRLSAISGAASASARSHFAAVAAIGADAALVGAPGSPKGTTAGRIASYGRWKNTAILVTEDDAQNGPDHVDAHRTLALVVSPYTQSGRVDPTH